jgi:phosphonate transport system substrate-binding protein
MLTFTSCHAPNLDDLCAAIVRYLSAKLSQPVTFVNDIAWQERYHWLDRGKIDIAWICAAPYVRRIDGPTPNIELLAAPVWRGERYGGMPIYFADVIVRADSPYSTFDNLRGAVWVYNEPGSLSGFEIMRHRLTEIGASTDYFARVLASGSHLKSLGMVLAGKADVTAIDSVVLEQHVRSLPGLADQIRTIASLGPLPSMPWVVGLHMAEDLRVQLRRLLVKLHLSAKGKALLAVTPLQGFAAVSDSDYESIRSILSG